MNNREKSWESNKSIKDRTRKEISDAINDREFGEIKNSKKDFLINTKDIIIDNPEIKEEIYSWYKSAIERRGRESLEEDRFVAHFFEGGSFDETFSYGDLEKGFLLGFEKYGVFIPTHFAPKTIRGGYELIKNLGESNDIPAVMSITPDLTDTISKMKSWHVVDLSFLSSFRDEITDKNIVYNNHPNVKNLMLGLVNKYLEESDSRVYGDDDKDEDNDNSDFEDGEENNNNYEEDVFEDINK